MWELFLQLVIMAAGFVLLIKGADFFVKGASAIAHKLGVPQIVIGLTVVAMGTSAPEAAVSISAAWTGNADLTIGNVVGSNIMNILIILGLTALIFPIAVEKKSVKLDIPFMILTTLLLIPMGLLGGSIDRWDGLILLILFTAYMVYLLVGAFKNKTPAEVMAEASETVERPVYGQGNVWTFFMTLIGLIMIVIGSRLTVYSATQIALDLGVSQRMIGLTIVAFGTSLPELVTSATAARRGDTGIAVGNIVGSNIFNVLFVTGLTAVITPVVFLHTFALDVAMAAAASILMWIIILTMSRINRLWGAIMLACYAGYFVWIVFF